ncbi:hypothetical protein [Streptomyces graminilatus]|uniref:hypothetical protein n=1 Tax=Streptomyces graminilatus TaxID=1464070 RepID=UPI001F5252E1|nr:hypothetical protein [Streptomyces graminilatus]
MPATAHRRKPAPAVLRLGHLGRLGRFAAMGTVTALILIAGVWASWGTAQHVMLSKGREQGTMTVSECEDGVCTGPYRPVSVGSQARDRVVLDQPVGVKEGETYAVIVKPGSRDVVRSGTAGFLYAWVPLGGALLLASVVVAGGLGLRRTGWALAGSGLAVVTAAWMALCRT